MRKDYNDGYAFIQMDLEGRIFFEPLKKIDERTIRPYRSL